MKSSGKNIMHNVSQKGRQKGQPFIHLKAFPIKILPLFLFISLLIVLILLKQVFIMTDTYHIRVKKEYAAKLLELLKTDDAIEDLELKQFELSDAQKMALDTELAMVGEDPAYLQEWDAVKARYKLK